MRMRRTVLSSVAYPSLPPISTLPHKGQDFRKDVIKNKRFVLTFCTFVQVAIQKFKGQDI